MEIKNIIETIVKDLVDNPDAVLIEEMSGTTAIVINIKVDQNDLGKIIGKKGRIISSIRTIFGSIFAKNGKKVIIEVNY